jgi:hypothetical protein
MPWESNITANATANLDSDGDRRTKVSPHENDRRNHSPSEGSGIKLQEQRNQKIGT